MLEEAVALALQLNPNERLKLIERVASSMENELAVQTIATPSETHWGQNLLRLLDEVGQIDLDHPEIQDPVEWVKQIRHEQATKRNLDWDDES